MNGDSQPVELAVVGRDQFREACLQRGLPTDVVETVVARPGPYEHHTVLLHPHRAVNWVLHAIPPIGEPLGAWEEWYFEGDQLRHAILTRQESEMATDTWFGEPDDLDHPDQVIGIRWYVTISHNRQPHQE
jgi:hypothetical protein